MQTPDTTIISGDRHRSHGDIRRRARQAAFGLRNLGIGEGDAIALLMRNDFPFFEAALAAKSIGAHAVPINWHATSDEASFILRDCSAKALIAHRDLLGLVDGSFAQPTFCVETPAEVRSAYDLPDGGGKDDGSGKDAPRWDEWIAEHPPLDAHATSASPAVIYTSGTTGRPKGVRRPAVASSKRSERALAVYGLDSAEPITALINGPMYHSVPNAFGRLAFQVSATIVLEARFDPEDMLALIARHRVTHMHIVPAVFIRLLRLPDAVKARHDISSLRYVVHGAAPCPPKIKRAMLDWWGPIIHEYYGSTETGLITRLKPDEAVRKPGSVGRALPGVGLEIHDPDGRPMPAGVEGDVFVRSAAGTSFSYIGHDRAETTRGDLVTAGDIGRLDADGYLFLRGRKREMIRSGDVTVHPSEIEAVLLDIRGVEDCAVFGIASDALGEAIHAYVEPSKGIVLDVSALQAELAVRLDPAMRPHVLEIVSELPREDSGKIFKRKLQERDRSR